MSGRRANRVVGGAVCSSHPGWGVIAVRRAVALVMLAVLGGWLPAQAQRESSPERVVATAIRQAADDPVRLRMLLARMPKGADLHVHFSGAVYAETLLGDARADLMCVNRGAGALEPNVGTTRSIPPQPVCRAGDVRAEDAFTDQRLYDGLIDSFSMRSFVPSSGISGHDQFFATFDRFDPTHNAAARHGGEWLDELTRRAASQNEQYVEIMHTPDLGRAVALSKAVSWPEQPATFGAFGEVTTGTDVGELDTARRAMMAAPEFAAAVEADRAEFHEALKDRRELQHCGQADAAEGCSVEVRFLFQVLRANPPALVFAQTLQAFEIAKREMEGEAQQAGSAAVLGLNFVQPEDGRVAMAEYTRQMRMIGYLHTLYPAVGITLHAGELTEGLVRPEGLRFHIRQAVEIGDAERIGHGVDVAYEDDAAGLLHELAAKHVMVEINLTSNDVILNVAGRHHPLPMYREAGVPVALSTDDEGVSRIDLTHEYVRAVMEYHLTYPELKTMVRTSLEHSFLPGASLWREPDGFGQIAPACAGEVAGGAAPRASCAAYLRGSARAAQQWELERRFAAFEASFAK